MDSSGQPIFRNYEEFHKAYAESYGKAMAYKEIFNVLENAGVMAKNLAEQDTKKKDYAIN